MAGCEYDEVKLVDNNSGMDDIIVDLNSRHVVQTAARHANAAYSDGGEAFNSLERFIKAVEGGEFTATELFALAFFGYNSPLSIKRIRAEVEAETFAKMLRDMMSQDASPLRSDE